MLTASLITCVLLADLLHLCRTNLVQNVGAKLHTSSPLAYSLRLIHMHVRIYVLCIMSSIICKRIRKSSPLATSYKQQGGAGCLSYTS